MSIKVEFQRESQLVRGLNSLYIDAPLSFIIKNIKR